jgi:hypothetical protein
VGLRARLGFEAKRAASTGNHQCSQTAPSGQTRLRFAPLRHGCSQLKGVARRARERRDWGAGAAWTAAGTSAFRLAGGIRRAIALATKRKLGRGWC